jgi:hypothetical protein
MNREQFVRHQRETFRYAMSSLLQSCEIRYLDAARLLEVDGVVIDGIGEARARGQTDLSPLIPAWTVICSRYLSEVFSLQVDLFDPEDEKFIRPWSEFLYQRLFPVLVTHDGFVRDLLRVVDLLPCRSKADASASLVTELTEMTFPSRSHF